MCDKNIQKFNLTTNLKNGASNVCTVNKQKSLYCNV